MSPKKQEIIYKIIGSRRYAPHRSGAYKMVEVTLSRLSFVDLDALKFLIEAKITEAIEDTHPEAS